MAHATDAFLLKADECVITVHVDKTEALDALVRQGYLATTPTALLARHPRPILTVEQRPLAIARGVTQMWRWDPLVGLVVGGPVPIATQPPIVSSEVLDAARTELQHLQIGCIVLQSRLDAALATLARSETAEARAFLAREFEREALTAPRVAQLYVVAGAATAMVSAVLAAARHVRLSVQERAGQAEALAFGGCGGVTA